MAIAAGHVEDGASRQFLGNYFGRALVQPEPEVFFYYFIPCFSRSTVALSSLRKLIFFLKGVEGERSTVNHQEGEATLN